MRRVMIVDDELFVRLGIKSIVNWEEFGYTVAAEAANGQEALEKMESVRPHIVFTDLAMDTMDGLALIEEGTKRFPETRFVVLSNYNDYENVRQAMKLGAVDYIFKLTAKKEEIAAVLQKVAGQEEEKRGIDTLLTKNYDAIKARLLARALRRDYWREEELLSEFAALPVKTDFSRSCVAWLLSVDDREIGARSGRFPDSHALVYSIQNIAEELLDGFEEEAYGGDEGELLLLLPPAPGSLAAFERSLAGIMERLAAYVSRYLGVSVSGALSRPFTGLEGLRRAVGECRDAMRARYFREGSGLIPAGEAVREDFFFPQGTGPQEWEELLRRKAYSELPAFLDRLWAFCRQERFCRSEPLQVGLMSLYSVLRRYAVQDGCDFDALRDANGLSLYEAIARYDRLSGVAAAFSAVLRGLGESLSAGGGRSEIAAVLRYLRDHLEEELSVPAAARLANMSESYFSHQFKEETGMSFVNYVNRERANRAAALLLSTDRKVGDVARLVGIDNPNYFSILFKKWMGLSPNDYREQNSGGKKQDRNTL